MQTTFLYFFFGAMFYTYTCGIYIYILYIIHARNALNPANQKRHTIFMGFKPSPAGTEDLLLHLFGRIVQQNLPRTARPSGSKQNVRCKQRNIWIQVEAENRVFRNHLDSRRQTFFLKTIFCTPNIGNYTAKQKVEAANKVHLIKFNQLATWCHQTSPRN